MNTCKIKVSSTIVFVKGLARETREASAKGIVHAKRLQSPTSWGRLKMFGLWHRQHFTAYILFPFWSENKNVGLLIAKYKTNKQNQKPKTEQNKTKQKNKKKNKTKQKKNETKKQKQKKNKNKRKRKTKTKTKQNKTNCDCTFEEH